MPRSYYVRAANGPIQGPMTAAEVRAAAAEGRLTAQDFIQTTDRPEWRPMASVVGLTFAGSKEDSVTLRKETTAVGSGQPNGHKPAEPSAVRSFASEEEATESALRVLASMRSQGLISEGEYQDRRRKVVGVSADQSIAVEEEPAPTYPSPRLDRPQRGNEVPAKRGGNPLLVLLVAIPICWLGYSYVVELGPFAKKQPPLPKRPAPQSRPTAAVAAQPQVDPRSSFRQFGNCIGGQLMTIAVETPSWWIDPSTLSIDLRQTSSLLHPVEGLIVCEMRSVAEGNYTATIHFVQQDRGWRAGEYEVRFNGSNLRDNHVGSAKTLLGQWLKALDYSKCP